MKATFTRVLIPIFLVFIGFTGKAQISVNSTLTPLQLAQTLAGPGITVSNASFTGAVGSAGSFTQTGACNLGISSGILLTSGSVGVAAQPNNTGSATVINLTPGDADLTTLGGSSSVDAAVLVFDFVAPSSSVQFNYVFGSEEYPEFVNLGYNDVFAFFISGPSIVTQNIAIVPGTPSTPVSINNINSTTNSAYYVNNIGGSCVQYDGFTTRLTASASGLIPCQTYTLKLAIADLTDWSYDSGVFLEENSLVSTGPTFSTPSYTAAGSTSATEGCVNGQVNLTLGATRSTPTVVNYTVAGTATPGVDYTAIGTSATIPANTLSTTITIQPLLDALAEGTETVKLYLTDVCGITYDSVTINITDRPTFVTSNDTSICTGGTVQMSATSGFSNYSWTPALEFTTATNIQSPSVAPTTTRTYTASTTFGSCTFTDTVRINVIATPFTVDAGPDINNCSGAPTQLNAVPVGSALPGNPFVYLWSPAGTLSNANISNPTVNTGVSGTYVVRLSSAQCFDTDTVTVTQGTLNATYTERDVRCFNLANGSAAVSSVVGTNPITYAWSNGAGNVNSISTLGPNTYTVTITDGVGCTTSHNFVITQPTQLTVSTSGVNPISCAGNGTATAVPAGGTAPYQYLWSNGATTATANNFSIPNTYTVTVTDDSLCTATASVNITSVAAPTTSGTVTDVLCNGASTGAINLTVSGTSGPYTFAWSNSAVTEDISGIPAGTYFVTVTDQNTCVVIDTFVVSQPATPLTVNTTLIRNVSCFGGNNGSAYAIAVNGTAPYNYNWSNAINNDTTINLSAGTVYTVTATDANSCTASNTITVTQPTAVTANTFLIQNVSCFGGNNGAAYATGSGGTGSFLFAWSNGVNNDTVTNLSAGTLYTVTVTDANSCTATATRSVTEPALLNASIAVVQNVSCFGGNNGSAFSTATGGTTPYNFNWSNGVNNDTTTGLSAGTVYTVTVTDANSCTATNTISVTQPAQLTVNTFVVSNVSCFGLSNGSAYAVANNGTAGYSYAWSNGINNDTTTGLAAGTVYTVTATDANSCTATNTISVTQPLTLTVSTSVVQNATCPGVNNGMALATANNGTGPYSYNWSNGINNDTTTGLAPSTVYTVTAIDANGCTATNTISISSPVGLTVNPSVVQNVSCFGANDGVATVVALNGTAPYTFNWSNGIVNDTTSGLAAGTVYTVTATDANGCSASNTISVTQPVAVAANVFNIRNVSCFNANDGEVYATGTGGTGAFTFAWSNGVNNDTITVLAAGTVYTVTATDANGCTATNTISVTQPAQLTVNTNLIQNVSCFGGNNGAAYATAAGGTGTINYAWSNSINNDTTTGLAAGTVYTVTATDANNCTATNTISVTQPTQLAVNTFVINNVSCFGLSNGAAYAVANNGTGPYNYAWSNSVSNDTTTGLAAGTVYTVTVTDANTCTVSNTISVTQPLALTVSTSVIQNLSCFGGNNGSAVATANNGTAPYNFAWSNGINNDTTINLSAGTVYTITATDANSCTATNTVSVTQPLALGVNTSVINNVSCFGGNNGSAMAIANNGTSPYSFAWSNGINNDTTTGLSAGTVYTVTAADANNCTATATVSVTEPTQFAVFISAIQNVLCNGQNNGSAFALGNGGVLPYSYAWSNGINDDTTTGLAPIIVYTVTATDANGCTATDNVSVIEPAVLTVSVTGTNINCFGGNNGTATATANGGTNPYTYNWNGFTGNPYNNLAAGTYPVTVIDDNGCTATDSVTLTQPARIEFDSVVITNVSCFGGNDGTITVYNSGGTGAYGYTWNNGVAAVSNPTGLAQGFYSVTVNDANNCTRDTAVTINQPAQLLVSTTVLNNISCNGANDGSAVATGSGGTGAYTFSWSSGATIDTAYNLTPGNVDVTATDANGCTAINNAFITEPNVLTSANVLGINYCATPAFGNDTITAFGGTAPYTYSVSTAGSNNTGVFTNLLANNYTYTVTDDNGCVDTGSLVVPVVPADTYTQNNTNISCFGGNDGVIDVTADVAANGPYQFSLDNGAFQGTGQFTALTATTYQVIAQNWFGCFDTLLITLTQPVSAVSVSITTTDVICNGDATGTALATGSGGTAGYTFAWSNGSVVDSAVALPAGNIDVTVTDANGCTASNTATVNEPPALTLNVTGTDVLCNGEATGTISAVGGGGVPGYGYSTSLDGVNFINSGTGQFTGLFAGNYTVYVNDNNSCVLTVPFVINEPPVLTLQLSTTDATCFSFTDGTITAVGGGGVGNFTYTLETGDNNTSGLFSNLGTGMYTVTLTDQNNCSYSDSIEVQQPDSMIVEVIPNIDTIVMGETLEINAQSNYSGVTYLWFPANALTCDNCDNPTFLGYNNQTIQVQGTDANGCVANSLVEIIVVPYYDVFTPNSFTPNADGSNDFWNTFIPKAEAVKGLEVQVFNRIGEKVFESFEVDFKWDGTYKGQPAPEGVYVYTMKMEWLNGHVSKVYKGTITLLR